MKESNKTPAFLTDALKYGINLGLDRMMRLDELLDHPSRRLKCIHIAGTNGKGSVTTYISSILAASGLKVGVYTSPYLERFSERMRMIDGRDGLIRLRSDETCGEIDPVSLEDIVSRVREACDIIGEEGGEHPTEFELTTAVAFVWFSEQNADVVVLETGLGGRLDSTNIIEKPLCTAITAIGMDHSDRLGSTIGEIAGEKAGIFKQGCPAVVSDPFSTILDSESAGIVKDVFAHKASEVSCPVEFVSAEHVSVRYTDDGKMRFSSDFTDGKEYVTSMVGRHQIDNCALAVACCRRVRDTHGLDISEEDIETGVRYAYWKGRAECLSTDPIVILDGGHNPQGATSLSLVMNDIFGGKLQGVPLRLVMGMMADKDTEGIIEAYRSGGIVIGELYGVTVNNPRSMKGTEICNQVKLVYNNGVKTVDSLSPIEAVRQAFSESEKDGMPLLVTGSLYLIGEVRATLLALATDGKE